MRIVIVGGGIAAAYLANNIKKTEFSTEVLILSDEEYFPYDRIHLCRLVDGTKTPEDIKLLIDPTVRVELNQKICKIDSDTKKVYSSNSMFSYDKLILSTGSLPVTLFDISNLNNCAVVRSADDCLKIQKSVLDYEQVVLVGSGPIGL